MYLLQWERVKSESSLDISTKITNNQLQESQNNQESHKRSKKNQESNNNQGLHQIIKSLTSKTMFFELFIKNKNLIT